MTGFLVVVVVLVDVGLLVVVLGFLVVVKILCNGDLVVFSGCLTAILYYNIQE